MNGFHKFKKRIALAALLKSAVWALSPAFVVFAFLLTLGKQRIWVLKTPYIVLISALVALIGFAVAFCLLRSNDKKAARLLDRELQLHEKVQTMVALKQEQGMMIELQRTDTEEKLAGRPVKDYKIKHGWIYLSALVLAVATALTATLLPAKAESTPPPIEENPFEISQFQIKALQELIETVRKSTMTESAKTAIVSDLEGLLATLSEVDKLDDMKSAVIPVITRTDALVSGLVTAPTMGDILKVSGFEPAQKLGTVLSGLNVSTLRDDMTTIRSLFVEENLASDINSFSATIKAALDSAALDKSDPLTQALSDLANAMATIYDTMSHYTDAWALSEVKDAFDTAIPALETALLQQTTDTYYGALVISTLMELFGIGTEDLPGVELNGSHAETNTPGEDTDQTRDENHSGGMGEGNVLYGSDDEIFDPDSGDYTVYGEVINDYYARIMEKVLDGSLPDGMKDTINAYYDLLFTKTEDESNESANEK